MTRHVARLQATSDQAARIQVVASKLGLRDWRSLPVLVATGHRDRLARDLDPGDRASLAVLDMLADGLAPPTHDVLQSPGDEGYTYPDLPPAPIAGQLMPGPPPGPIAATVIAPIIVWEGLLAIEGYRSPAGRYVDPFAILWSSTPDGDLLRPLPLLAIDPAGNPIDAGTIDRVWRHQPDPRRPVFHVMAAGRVRRPQAPAPRSGPWAAAPAFTSPVYDAHSNGAIDVHSGDLADATIGPVGTFIPSWPECLVSPRKAPAV